MYDTSLSKICQGYGAMQKENKRCIPKEGMPLLTPDFGTCHGGVLQRKKGSALYDRWI